MSLISFVGYRLVELRAPSIQIHGDIYQVPSTVLVAESSTGTARFIQIVPEITPVAGDDFICTLSFKELISSEVQSMAAAVEIIAESSHSNEIRSIDGFLDRRLLRSGGNLVGPSNALSALRLNFKESSPFRIWHDQNQGEEELTMWDIDPRLAARFDEQLELVPSSKQ